MSTQIRFAAADGRPAQPVLVMDFAVPPETMSLADQENELRIQAHGLLLHAEMLAYERTGDRVHHDNAERAKLAMYALIANRSPERKAAMERALGDRSAFEACREKEASK